MGEVFHLPLTSETQIQMHMREQMELFAAAIEQEMSSLLGLIVRPEVRCCFR